MTANDTGAPLVLRSVGCKIFVASALAFSRIDLRSCCFVSTFFRVESWAALLSAASSLSLSSETECACALLSLLGERWATDCNWEASEVIRLDGEAAGDSAAEGVARVAASVLAATFAGPAELEELELELLEAFGFDFFFASLRARNARYRLWGSSLQKNSEKSSARDGENRVSAHLVGVAAIEITHHCPFQLELEYAWP